MLASLANLNLQSDVKIGKDVILTPSTSVLHMTVLYIVSVHQSIVMEMMTFVFINVATAVFYKL